MSRTHSGLSRRLFKPVSVIFLSASVVVALAGCGTGGSTNAATNAPTSAAGGTGTGTGTLDGGGKNIIVFMPTTSNSYMKADSDSIKSEAASLNFKVKTYENNFDQTEQDQQVRDWLASGESAAAILVWPSTAAAATNSIRLLTAKAPVFQFNQGVQPDAASFVTAYAGVSDKAIGEQAGMSALKALAAQKTAGVKFHGPGGKPNLLEFRFPTGYVAGDDRDQAFRDATGGAFNILHVEPGKATDAQAGFKMASQIVPKYKPQGIDFIYSENNNMGTGVVQALVQNGFKPGKDVIVVAGDYSGDKQPLKDGLIYSAVIQSPVIEGMLIVRTAAQYLATGKVADGTAPVQVQSTPDKPKLLMVPPAKTTFMMNPEVNASNYSTFKIWGLTIDQLVK